MDRYTFVLLRILSVLLSSLLSIRSVWIRDIIALPCAFVISVNHSYVFSWMIRFEDVLWFWLWSWNRWEDLLFPALWLSRLNAVSFFVECVHAYLFDTFVILLIKVLQIMVLYSYEIARILSFSESFSGYFFAINQIFAVFAWIWRPFTSAWPLLLLSSFQIVDIDVLSDFF